MEPNQGETHLCVPEVAGTCLAWGDPHIVTFDQYWTEVRAIGEYRLAEFVGDRKIFTFNP